MFRLIATDIDGTLAHDDRHLSPYTVRTLQAAIKAGIPIVLVTGANPWTVRRHLQRIGPQASAICLNGIFVLKGNAQHAGKFTPPEVVREAVRVIHEAGYVPLVYGEDNVSRYLPAPDPAMDKVRRLIAERPYQPYREVSGLRELLSVRPAQVSVCETLPRGKQLYTLLEHTVGDRAYVVFQPGTRTWIEVNHPEARKDTALLALAETLNVAPDEIVYFGDNLNDLPLFHTLKHCVAMGNAHPEITALAWRSAPTNNEDGVAQTILALSREGLLPPLNGNTQP